MYVRNNYYHIWMYNDNIDCKRNKKIIQSRYCVVYMQYYTVKREINGYF